jgi:hypothetical protein
MMDRQPVGFCGVTRPAGPFIPMETWRAIIGYEGLYEVSDLGRVRSLDRIIAQRDGRSCRYRGKVLRPQPATDGGYYKVRLSNCGVGKTHYTHRLVLDAFIGAAPDGMECLHGNGDPADNRLANLRWGSSSDNQLDKVSHGRHHNAVKQHCPRDHPLQLPNLVPSHLSRGGRNCLACHRAQTIVWKAARAGRVLALKDVADRKFAEIMERAS